MNQDNSISALRLRFTSCARASWHAVSLLMATQRPPQAARRCMYPQTPAIADLTSHGSALLSFSGVKHDPLGIIEPRRRAKRKALPRADLTYHIEEANVCKSGRPAVSIHRRGLRRPPSRPQRRGVCECSLPVDQGLGVQKSSVACSSWWERDIGIRRCGSLAFADEGLTESAARGSGQI